MDSILLTFFNQTLAHPLLDPEVIHARQDAVAEFLSCSESCKEIRAHLSQVRDLERLMMRIETGYASPRDLAGLRLSLEHVEPLAALLLPVAVLVEQARLAFLERVALVQAQEFVVLRHLFRHRRLPLAAWQV